MHTQGLLEVSSAGHGDARGSFVRDEYFVRIAGDDIALAAEVTDPATGKPSEANARRLAACWNACEGLDNSILAVIGAFGGMSQDSAVRAIAQQLEALTATKLEALPTEGLVWVCLNAEGMPPAGIREHLGSLTDVLTKAKVDGKTSAQFIMTASLWPGQIQIQALPDEELARIGLMRDYVAKGLLAELQSLSVENIMLDVVPGFDGMGYEVYAKSVDDVRNAFSLLIDKFECMEGQRDELLGILEDLMTPSVEASPEKWHDAKRRARTAIAKARGAV